MRGPWAKWSRAQTHLVTLGDKCGGKVPGYTQDWLHMYRATAETHRNGLEYRFFVEPPPLDFDELALIAGDFLFDLRSALDHVVYELTKRRGKAPAYIGFRPAFPILDARGLANHNKDPAKWNEIRDLTARRRTAVLQFQPYVRRNDKYRRIRESLLTLSTLNNVDKHRHLHLIEVSAFMAPVASYATNPAQYGFRQESFLGDPLVGKTEVLRWTFDTIPPDVASEIERQRPIGAAVTLDEEGERDFLMLLMRRLFDDVTKVLERFDRILPY